MTADESARAKKTGMCDTAAARQSCGGLHGQVICPSDLSPPHRRGNTTLVNGTPSAIARVPGRLVRLRFVNGSNARIFDLSFDDQRSFHWIASEGGLLEEPIELRSLTFAPGERVEILVNFSDGRHVALQTALDTNLPMMMGPLALGRSLGNKIFGTGNEVVLRFEPFATDPGPALVPRRLIARQRLDPSQVKRRRSVVPNMGMGGMMGGRMGSGGGMTINGRPFDMNRIDERVPLGDTEIWEVSGEMMSHPFHIHGVQFELLSRKENKPTMRDAGARDTVLVKEPVELIMRFTQPAVKAPFMYHCHILEHEDNGMMGQFVTT